MYATQCEANFAIETPGTQNPSYFTCHSRARGIAQATISTIICVPSVRQLTNIPADANLLVVFRRIILPERETRLTNTSLSVKDDELCADRPVSGTGLPNDLQIFDFCRRSGPDVEQDRCSRSPEGKSAASKSLAVVPSTGREVKTACRWHRISTALSGITEGQASTGKASPVLAGWTGSFSTDSTPALDFVLATDFTLRLIQPVALYGMCYDCKSTLPIFRLVGLWR